MGKDPNNPLDLYAQGRAKGSPFEQECCGRVWLKQSDFKRHSATHDPNSRHICQFEGCGKSFNQKTALKTHVNSHIGARPHKCRIEDCTADFADPSSRGRHEREVHDPSFGYQCKNCSYSTKRREQFAGHWKDCLGGPPETSDYKAAQKTHEAAYMELVKQGLRPAPPVRPKIYKARKDAALSSPTRPSPAPIVTITPSPQSTDHAYETESPSMPDAGSHSPSQALKNPFANLANQSRTPGSGPFLTLPDTSPTPSHGSNTSSLFSESEDQSLVSMLNNPSRRLMMRRDASPHIIPPPSSPVYDYPSPPMLNTLGMDPVAPMPIRDPGCEIPILGQHRYSPYSPRPARWTFPVQGNDHPPVNNVIMDSGATLHPWIPGFR